MTSPKPIGCNGTYVEPRSPDGRHPDDSFQVVWLPRKTFGEAQVCQKTSKTPTTLVRQADRYGLRVLNDEAEALHRIHRPDLVYIQGTELTKYRVGPMPFGSTKQSLVHVFSKWGWKARPLAPQGQAKDRSGVMWVVQAAEPPSHWVFQLSHGDVLIFFRGRKVSQCNSNPKQYSHRPEPSRRCKPVPHQMPMRILGSIVTLGLVRTHEKCQQAKLPLLRPVWNKASCQR